MDKDKLYLSALSGGADSTALLLYLLGNGYRVEAVHCNFHLRGEESDRDENFCKKLCEDNGVKLHIAHFDTTSYAELHHESIETAARNLRYRYFFQLACDIDAAGICIAHNRNDQAETMLMNLVRGAGIHGLAGMKRVNHVQFRDRDILVIRPLLDVSRKEIVEFLNKRHQSWVTDSTNLEDDATRNKFRLDIIPLLEKINPSAIENIAKACGRLRQVTEIYDEAIDKASARVVSGTDEKHISISSLMKETSPETVLFEVLSPLGFNSAQVADIFARINSNSGKEWGSSSHRLFLERGELVAISNDSVEEVGLRIPEEGSYVFGKNHKIKLEPKEWNADSKVSKDANKVCLDSSKISFPLTLRNIKPGDRFVPFGMKGSKLVSDFLTDHKVPLYRKLNQLVLCDSNGNIIWLVGLRPDNHYRITPSTTEALVVSLINP